MDGQSLPLHNNNKKTTKQPAKADRRFVSQSLFPNPFASKDTLTLAGSTQPITGHLETKEMKRTNLNRANQLTTTTQHSQTCTKHQIEIRLFFLSLSLFAKGDTQNTCLLFLSGTQNERRKGKGRTNWAHTQTHMVQPLNNNLFGTHSPIERSREARGEQEKCPDGDEDEHDEQRVFSCLCTVI